MKPALLQQILQRAAGEELGLAVETNNPNYLYQLLSNMRKALGLDLIIARPPGDEVFIMKRTTEGLDD
jgi:hypothetical protein